MVKSTNIVRNTGIAGITIFIFSLCLAACSDMHAPYQEYIEDEEIIYRGKADSVAVFPGKNRIQLQWWYSDHKVTRSVVSWDADEGSDSVEVELPGTQGVDTVTVILNDMEEQSYNFEITNYDNEGNSSLSVSVLGSVYGSVYESTLLNRPVVSAIAEYEPGSSAFLEWGSSASSAIVVQVTYTDTNDIEQTVSVSPDEVSTELPEIKPGSIIQYQTLHLPEPIAIDTFYAEAETQNVLYEMPLENAGFPFEHAEWDGNRYGNLENWMANDEVKNHGGYGGYDGIGGGYLFMQKWNDNHSEIINGKIYQTMVVPPGRYSFEANFSEANASNNIEDFAYMVVAEGNLLPDIAEIENQEALGYTEFDAPEIEFTLNQETEISVGFVATLQQNRQNFRCHLVRLFKLE